MEKPQNICGKRRKLTQKIQLAKLFRNKNNLWKHSLIKHYEKLFRRRANSLHFLHCGFDLKLVKNGAEMINEDQTRYMHFFCCRSNFQIILSKFNVDDFLEI